MAKKKKVEKVVITAEYLQLLVDKADALDRIFSEAGACIVIEDFKMMKIFDRRFSKLDISQEEYVEPTSAGG